MPTLRQAGFDAARRRLAPLKRDYAVFEPEKSRPKPQQLWITS